ncbi:FBD protein [Medicago truncatula]|uniref:FBD protein n=1 Tax=Medicago truncatula TaxID=3880 RepID=A0A072UV46_MEDTR|nr:FBD protein [Medicago truncatula]
MNLQVLNLKKIIDCLDRYDNEEVAKDWKNPPIVPQCLSSQLKTFVLIDYKDKKKLFRVASIKELVHGNNFATDHSFKTRLGHRLGGILGQWVNGRIIESLVEPHD